MSIGSTKACVGEYFYRHFVTGVVFFLFLFLLPLAVLDGMSNGLLKQFIEAPVTAVLFILAVGLFLNSTKTYRFAWVVLGVTEKNLRADLRGRILKGFKINLLRSKYQEDPDYMNRAQRLSARIVDNYLVLYHRDFHQQLQARRAEVDVMAFSLASMMGFAIILGTYSLFKILPWLVDPGEGTVPLVDFCALVASLSVTYFVRRHGQATFTKRLEHLNQFTELLLDEASQIDRKKWQDRLERFLNRLKEDALIEDVDGTLWVKEMGKSKATAATGV